MKDIILAKYCCASVAFVCITFAALKFESTGFLWWYIAPILIVAKTI